MPPDHVLVIILAAVLVAAWDGFCLYDLARAREVRVLPKWVWAVICLISLRCQPSRELPPLCVVQSAPRTEATARHAARNAHVLTFRIDPTLQPEGEHANGPNDA